ncbi:MAG: beta-glycosidase, partial [Bacteroidia bacterium]|nr:beta-glycosidase [Bacteroidia bacterium]
MYLRLLQVLALTILINSCSTESGNSLRQKISLDGKWNFALDSSQVGINDRWFDKTLPEVVQLPGTLDENGKGIPNTNTGETMRLSRELVFEGWSWYRKIITIPPEWQVKDIRLIMERAKPSTLWIDSVMAGTNNSILAPQLYNLSPLIKPGSHSITILINNGRGSVPMGITGSHAWTEHTQTNWNGIIGEFCLEAYNPDHIESVKVYPDSSLKSILVKTRIYSAGNNEIKAVINLRADSWNSLKKHNIRQRSFPVVLKPGMNELELNYRMGNRTILWSEFNPALYKLSIKLSEKELADTASVNFGMRKFTTKGTRFTINGAVTFLRGKHDACVFPLTGHPPMDVESWRKVFRIAKSYNINFYRFHSWTPPEAAFEAADIEGIYMQPELPFWGGFSKTRNADLNEFLMRTGENILESYGNHASFVMFALGNELSGDQEVMKDFLTHFRSIDNRPLLAYGSNNYLGSRGQAEREDYYAGCRIGPDTDTTYNTHIRASFSFADAYDGGYINGRYPSTALNYSGAISKCSVPAISTEVGQYQIYPNYDEIKKYTGVLKP